MEVASRRFGRRGQFFSTPTALFASFGQGPERRTLLERVEPGDVDLDTMHRLDHLLARFAAGTVGAEGLARGLEQIAATPVRYGALLTTLSFALVSGTAAQFFGCGLREVAAATAVGLVPGLLALLVARWPRPAASSSRCRRCSSPFSHGDGRPFGPLSTFLVILSGLIVLVPGLTLTVATTELATRHLVSGGARMAGAVLIFLGIAFGVAVGTYLGTAVFGTPRTIAPVPLPHWTQWVALPIAAGGFTVLFRAHPRDAGWVFLAGVVAVEGGQRRRGAARPAARSLPRGAARRRRRQRLRPPPEAPGRDRPGARAW